MSWVSGCWVPQLCHLGSHASSCTRTHRSSGTEADHRPIKKARHSEFLSILIEPKRYCLTFSKAPLTFQTISSFLLFSLSSARQQPWRLLDLWNRIYGTEKKENSAKFLFTLWVPFFLQNLSDISLFTASESSWWYRFFLQAIPSTHPRAQRLRPAQEIPQWLRYFIRWLGLWLHRNLSWIFAPLWHSLLYLWFSSFWDLERCGSWLILVVPMQYAF